MYSSVRDTGSQKISVNSKDDQEHWRRTPTTLDQSFSPYFDDKSISRVGSSSMHGEDTSVITLDSSSDGDTPLPGYKTFANHLEGFDGASTPMARPSANEQSASTPTVALGNGGNVMRKLEFGQGESPQPKRRRKNDLSAIVASAASSMDADVTLTSQPIQPGFDFVKPATPRRRKSPVRRVPRDGFVSMHFINEEIVMTAPLSADQPGLKQVKLRDTCSQSEIVDFLLHPDTLSWDIVPDETTQRLRFVVNQKIDFN